MIEAIEHIRSRCRAAGKHAGLFCSEFCSEPAYARAMIEKGSNSSGSCPTSPC